MMKISEYQFLLLGQELDRRLEQVARRISDLHAIYFSDRNKRVTKGRTIQFELRRTKEYYTERDPRLWDALYYLAKSGIKLKSFKLPPDFIPLKEQMKDLDDKITPMRITR